MRNTLMAVTSFCMISCLGLYGIRALAVQAAGPMERGVQSGPTAGERQDMAAELAVVDRLGVTRRQRQLFVAAKLEMQARTRAMMRLASGHAQRGADSNRWWNQQLRRIFSAKQYSAYCVAWGAAYSPMRKGPARVGGPGDG